jgi:citrate lyase alpha subunit
MKELYDLAISFTKVPNKIKFTNQQIGVSLYRDGTILDNLYAVDEL